MQCLVITKESLQYSTLKNNKTGTLVDKKNPKLSRLSVGINGG